MTDPVTRRAMAELRAEIARLAMDRNAHLERAERAVAQLAAERERCARECAAAIRKGE